MVKIVSQLNSRQYVVECKNKCYLVSESKPNSGVPLETLVFASDKNGSVSDWIEVDGEVGTSVNDYLSKLVERGYVV